MNISTSRRHLVLLCGGRSAEHEVSFQSAAAILQYLDKTKYRISVLGIEKNGSLCAPEITKQNLQLECLQEINFPNGQHWIPIVIELTPAPEMILPILHGPFGEDGTVQGVLEVLDIPYVGAGVSASAIAMDKIYSKKLLLQEGLPILPFFSLNHETWKNDREYCLRRVVNELSYPVFVKPANLGSSIGVSKSNTKDELLKHVEIAFNYDDHIIVEQAIDAREIEVSVLGNTSPQVSIAGEIIPSREFYSYEAKYLDKTSELLIPAPISQEQMKHVRDLALETFKILRLEGMARIDFLMDRDTGKFWISEPNTMPGFTDVSMYPKLWEASGLDYTALLDSLIDLGLERNQVRGRFSVDRHEQSR
ncbi:MAG: D-alanine--D-alanine ligase family protein [Acidobacteriota bacterium]|nr:D-alanine--D-alanine ligase family protein [Acidobacteriota bacterium]